MGFHKLSILFCNFTDTISKSPEILTLYPCLSMMSLISLYVFVAVAVAVVSAAGIAAADAYYTVVAYY